MLTSTTGRYVALEQGGGSPRATGCLGLLGAGAWAEQEPDLFACMVSLGLLPLVFEHGHM